MSYNGFREEGAKALAELLHTNTGITYLNLSGNSIGPEGARAIADAIVTKVRDRGLNTTDRSSYRPYW
jgi:Ran GTPase-activating protein (RanGAP) involved in mRNA processing and transport